MVKKRRNKISCLFDFAFRAIKPGNALTTLCLAPLIFYHSIAGHPKEVLEKVVAQFNVEHAVNEISLQHIANFYPAAVEEALKASVEERPDLVLAPEFLTGKMQQALSEGVVISIKDLLAEERLADIAPLVKATFGSDCLPLNPACGILYINRGLLTKAGYSAGYCPQTLEELKDTSLKLVEEGLVSYGYTCAWPEAYLVEVALAQRNISLLDESGRYCFRQLLNHLMHLRSLVRQRVLLLPAVGNYDITRQRFIEGEVAFYMQGSGHFRIIMTEAEARGVVVDFAALPSLAMEMPGQKYAFPLGGAALWAMRKEAADDEMLRRQRLAEFLNYLASKEIQLLWHRETGYVPVSSSIRSDHEDFYRSHKLHDAVVKQTIDAPIGQNSFGIKKSNYALVRRELYPLLRELLLLQVSDIEAAKVMHERLLKFDEWANAL